MAAYWSTESSVSYPRPQRVAIYWVVMFCDKSTQDLLEDKNGPLRRVSTAEGVAEKNPR